jgi:class 3 adenylate cyclase
VGAVTGTLTVVFTDLAESTALRARLGERLADAVRRDHDRALAEVVARHHGRVVKATGDGILAVFESASDAVAASAAMQQAIHSLGRARGFELAIRMGLSAGDVSWEDGDCFGLPVVEAARLEEAAEPGQILCPEIVRALARGRADVEFRAIGAVSM